jgi:hypothetical protein
LMRGPGYRKGKKSYVSGSYPLVYIVLRNTDFYQYFTYQFEFRGIRKMHTGCRYHLIVYAESALMLNFRKDPTHFVGSGTRGFRLRSGSDV